MAALVPEPAAPSSPLAAASQSDGMGTPDPELRRLRALLRLQLVEAERGDWGSLGALWPALHTELERQQGVRASLAAVAEVAHLQLRLGLVLQSRAEPLVAALRGLRAGSAYRALAGRRVAPAPSAASPSPPGRVQAP